MTDREEPGPHLEGAREVCALVALVKCSKYLWIQKFTALAMRFERGAVRVIRPARKEKRTATPRGLKKMIRTPPTTMESLESQHFLRCCAAADDDSLANRLEAPTFVYSRVESREPTAED